jgi:hypothetical protein
VCFKWLCKILMGQATIFTHPTLILMGGTGNKNTLPTLQRF